MSVAYRTEIASVSRPRLKRLRFLAILFATLLLGLVSFVFGMFIAVASDLPSLQKFAELGEAKSSVLVDDLGRPLAVLSEHNRVIVTQSQIPPIVKEAVVSIEDKRFQTNRGVDIRGICLYPICNHPGWADDRHCHNGLWDYADDNGDREIYRPLADEVRAQLPSFRPAAARHAWS